MEFKGDFKIKTEPLMQTITVVCAILSIAGIIISLDSPDHLTSTAAIASITALTLLLRLL